MKKQLENNRLDVQRLVSHAREVWTQKEAERKFNEDAKRLFLPSDRVGIYTPQMLRRFLDWTGDTCAFPFCDETLTACSTNQWHLCATHNTRFSMARNARRKRAGLDHYTQEVGRGTT